MPTDSTSKTTTKRNKNVLYNKDTIKKLEYAEILAFEGKSILIYYSKSIKR